MRRASIAVVILWSLFVLLSCSGDWSGDGTTGPTGTELTISGAPTTSAVVGRQYQFQPVVTTPQGETFAFTITNQPPWTTFDATTGILLGTPAAGDVGEYNDIRITVTSGGDSAVLTAFSIVVSDTPAVGKTFSFVVFGDLNGGGCRRNDRVNRMVQHVAGNAGDAAFFLSTGDVVDGYWSRDQKTTCFASDPVQFNAEAACDDGIPNGNMAEILSPLKDRAPVEGLAASFYMALGNHDANWGSGWYPDPCGQGICEFLAPLKPANFINHPFDADQICNLEPDQSSYPDDFYYSFAFQNSYFIVLQQNNDHFGMLSCNNLPASYTDCAQYCTDPALFGDAGRNNRCYNIKQFDWLHNELTKATEQQYQHIFVFAHAPLVTSSDNHPPTNGHAQIRELLEQYGVDIYFNGHNHAYERTHPLKGEQIDTGGTVYITVGSGGASTDTVTGDWFTAADANDFARYGESGYADKMTTYTKITINGASVSGEVISIGATDEPVDRFTLQQNSGPETAGPNIAGCRIFPVDNMWNTPIDQLDLDPRSDAYISSIGGDTPVHPDFGTEWNGADIGIPFDIIDADQPNVDVSFLYYDETDPLDMNSRVKPYPVPANPSIEGGSDHHVLLVQKDTCMLYELFAVEKNASGSWTAGSGAVWDLSLNQVRPEGVTSADAGGLAILPGLVRYEEVFGDPSRNISPGIHHALRITISQVQRGYIRPASHSDGRAGSDPDYPPMGLRLRLKADVDISTYDAPIQVILTAMKKYGVVVADTGTDLYLSGTHDDRWEDDQLRQLKSIKASDFEAVYTGPIIPY